MTQPEPQATDTQVEAQLTALILAALTAWLVLVFPAVMATAVFGGVADVSAMWRFQEVWTAQVDRLMPYLARLARRGWLKGNSDLGTSVPFDPNSPELEELLTRTRNLLVRIPDEVYRQVIKSLAVGRDRGETNTQLNQRISNVLNINGSENWPSRAAVIARTELNRYESAGTLALGRTVVQASGRRIVKKWVDRDDGRVRVSHSRADGQVRNLSEPFEVGASLLQHPEDPTGPASETVNCRCIIELMEAR